MVRVNTQGVIVMRNIGHRLGGDVLPEVEENTLDCIAAAWELEGRLDFLYWEFDVQETADGELVVFHDRVVELSGQRIRVRDMTCADFRNQISSERGFEVPLLAEVLDALSDAKKPLRIEIKLLHSDAARNQILAMVEERKKAHGWDCRFIAFPSHFRRSFPEAERGKWQKEMKSRGLSIVMVGRPWLDLFKAERNNLTRLLARIGLGSRPIRN